MPVPIAWSDGGGTEMSAFRPSSDAATKPQAWMSNEPLTAITALSATKAGQSADSSRVRSIGPASAAPSIIPVIARQTLQPHIDPTPGTTSSWLSPSAPSASNASVSATSPTAATSSSSSNSSNVPTPTSSTRSVSFRLSSSRRASRRPSATLTAHTATSIGGSSVRASGAPPSSITYPSSADALDGYTVIDIRSLPASRTASVTTSPAHSPQRSPAPPRRVNALKVDTAQLMAAAEEEDVSPRTALFLAMKQKAKAEKKKLKKAKERNEKEKEKERQRPQQPNNSGQSSSSGTAQTGTAGKRHTLQPYSSASSVSSSLHSLSLSPEISSLSASLSLSPRSSLSRSSMEDDRRGERRLKKDERHRLGYKLCKVSGCMEARGRDEDGHHYKYCKAHIGIHTHNNPNTRKHSQRTDNQ